MPIEFLGRTSLYHCKSRGKAIPREPETQTRVAQNIHGPSDHVWPYITLFLNVRPYIVDCSIASQQDMPWTVLEISPGEDFVDSFTSRPWEDDVPGYWKVEWSRMWVSSETEAALREVLPTIREVWPTHDAGRRSRFDLLGNRSFHYGALPCWSSRCVLHLAEAWVVCPGVGTILLEGMYCSNA